MVRTEGSAFANCVNRLASRRAAEAPAPCASPPAADSAFAVACNTYGEVTVAFEPAGGEASKGIQHAEVVEGIRDEGVAQDVRAENGDRFANLGGGNLLSGLKAVDGTL